MLLRSSWPAERRDEDLRLLHSCYVEQGFSSSKVEKLLRRACQSLRLWPVTSFFMHRNLVLWKTSVVAGC